MHKKSLPVAFPPLQIHHQITPRLLSIPEAAAYIGGTNWFVEELLRDGKLEAVKVGKGRRIDRAVLDAWIDAEEARQKEKPPELGGFAKKYQEN